MDDFGGFDSGGFSLFGGDTPDFGTSYDFGGDVGSLYGGGSDLMGQFSLGGPSPALNTNGLGGGAMGGTNGLNLTMPGGGGGLPMGGGGVQPGGGGAMGGLGSLQGLLGMGGAAAGLIGTLMGGGKTGATMPKIPTAAMAQLNQSNQALQPFAQGQMPLQQQQASMLQALSQGQIPQGYADLVARAYDPAYQDAATRATNAGRQAGFYDAPGSSPPGGAIMGPAAAQLQGQQANSLLGLMQSLPQLFNQPIATQAGAAANQSRGLLSAAGAQIGQQQSAPLGPQIGAQVGGALQGLSQGMGQQQQQQFQNQMMSNQQNFQNSLLQQMMRQNQGPYQFGGYSGV